MLNYQRVNMFIPGWWFQTCFIFHFIYGIIIILPIDKLIFWKRWLLHHCTTNQIHVYNGLFHMMIWYILYIYIYTYIIYIIYIIYMLYIYTYHIYYIYTDGGLFHQNLQPKMVRWPGWPGTRKKCCDFRRRLRRSKTTIYRWGIYLPSGNLLYNG